ncbi:MAG: ABC transporter substrate-binding protein [Syntrophales bacterium LBB04]|nr:ABC transporter substrate-binding protein [Syntrophales bacterium LBB04]
MKRVAVLQTVFIMILVESIMLFQPFIIVQALSAPNAPVKAGAKGTWETEWNRAVESAKQEGKVLVYSTPSGDVIRSVAEAFEKKYGIKVEWVVGRGEELAQRMQTERNAGIKAVDVVISGGPSTQTVMKPLGLLGRLDAMLMLPEVLDPQAWITKHIPYLDKDHTGLAMLATLQRYITRNTTMVSANEITAYKDLLNPKWKGKITVNDPTVAGTASAFFTMLAVDVWGPEETKEFMRQFVKQEPAVTRDRRLQAEWVARGKYALSVATNLENVIDFIKLGSPIDSFKMKEGSMVGPGAGGLAVAISPAHPNAAKVFVNWLLTKDGHAVFVKAYGSPGIRKDAPGEGIPQQMVPDADEKIYEDDEESILYRDKTIKMAKEIFAPLFK